MPDPIRIVQLSAENVMRLSVVSITPDPQGNLIVVGGRNGAGKSSVLNSIAMALGGRKLCPEEPIKTGHTKAKVQVTLDNGLVIERRFTAKGDYLHVSRGDGEKVSRPQEILDELTGALTFDPLQFVRMSSDERSATLHGIVDVDVSSFQTRRENLYLERRDASRLLRAAEGALTDMPEVEGDVPDEEVSIGELTQTLEAAQLINAKAAELEQVLQSKVRQLAIWVEHETEAEKLVEQHQYNLDAAQERLISAKRHVTEGQQQREQALHDVKQAEVRDTAELRSRILKADDTNRAIRFKKRRDEQRTKVAELRKETDDFTTDIEALDAKKAQALADAEYPIKGLALTPDGGVVYNKVPYEQASHSEQLKISMAIGLALNPTLHVMLIYDGSLLDDESLAEVAGMAADANAQVWLERAGEGQECSVIIEEGRVKA